MMGKRTSWLIALACAIASGSAREFRPIFDGRSLDGWATPSPAYWSVEDGAITGRITKENPCATNQYLVWKGGELADFELKLKSRLTGEGGINNGFQFRSRLLPDHDVCGYQVDNNLKTPWLARLYDEYGRHTLAWRGEKAVLDSEGRRVVSKIAEAEGPAWFRLEDWHEYHLICVGPKIVLRIDGRVVAEVEDNDPRRREDQGILALQLHSGPPTLVQFKNIELKVLKPAVPRSVAKLSAAQKKLRREAVAWWPLDVGGHGATPRLRHIPDFDKFELHVRGPRPGVDVVVLHGAYFDAGTNLHAGESALTVRLRARDPHGKWNAGLFAKRGGHDRVHFNLFSADLPETPGPDIGFEVRTDRGFAMVSFPVERIDGTGWHDLAGRYDGARLDVFCDGKLMASKPWTGKPVQNNEPLLIAAETDGGRVVRHFHGELEEAAIWSRALTDEELASLSLGATSQ